MKSKIINMAERIKDAEDKLLETLFASSPVADDGFSARVVRKLRRRQWLRRLILPTAAAIGGTIAFKPLAGLIATLSSLSALIPQDAVIATTGIIPHMQTVTLGVLLLAVCLLGMRLLEE